MAEGLNKKNIRQVFRDVQKHLRVGQLIRRFSTNKADIRKTALGQIDLANCRNVLELGCAFGAFTEALQGKLHPTAKITGLDIIPEYGPFFLEACKRAGYAGTFSAAGIEQIKKYPAASFDLVICSYALYFFPHIISDISRVLTKEGIFITITHSVCDMQELVETTKNIMKQSNLPGDNQPLPIEIIVGRFSAENGNRILAPFFGEIRTIDFNNKLIFQPQEVDYFLEYFQFKKSFFLMETDTHKKNIADELVRELKDAAAKGRNISMCKNDKIFIASQPIASKELK